MAKKNTARTFNVAVRVDSRKLKNSNVYSVQVRVTGGQWVGKALRGVGRLLRWPVVAVGRAVALATALARLAS